MHQESGAGASDHRRTDLNVNSEKETKEGEGQMLGGAEELEVKDREEEQRRCTEMRMRMLRFWTNAKGHRVGIECYGKTVVRGVFKGTDARQEVLLVDQLETPMGTYSHTMLRSSDAIVMDFED